MIGHDQHHDLLAVNLLVKILSSPLLSPPLLSSPLLSLSYSTLLYSTLLSQTKCLATRYFIVPWMALVGVFVRGTVPCCHGDNLQQVLHCSGALR